MAGCRSIPPPGSSVRRAGHPVPRPLPPRRRRHVPPAILGAGEYGWQRRPAGRAPQHQVRDPARGRWHLAADPLKAPAEDRAEQELRDNAPSCDRQISERVFDTAPFPLSSRHDCLQAWNQPLRLFALRGRFDPQRRRTTEARKNWKSGTAMTGTFYERPILN